MSAFWFILYLSSIRWIRQKSLFLYFPSTGWVSHDNVQHCLTWSWNWVGSNPRSGSFFIIIIWNTISHIDIRPFLTVFTSLHFLCFDSDGSQFPSSVTLLFFSPSVSLKMMVGFCLFLLLIPKLWLKEIRRIVALFSLCDRGSKY